jgi:hypothetical protein
MEITLTIPDNVAVDLQNGYSAPIARRLLELAAIRAYEAGLITERQVMDMLGFTSRAEELYPFFKTHDVRQHYTLEDLERDRATLAPLFDRK